MRVTLTQYNTLSVILRNTVGVTVTHLNTRGVTVYLHIKISITDLVGTFI